MIFDTKSCMVDLVMVLQLTIDFVESAPSYRLTNFCFIHVLFYPVCLFILQNGCNIKNLYVLQETSQKYSSFCNWLGLAFLVVSSIHFRIIFMLNHLTYQIIFVSCTFQNFRKKIILLKCKTIQNIRLFPPILNQIEQFLKQQ